MRKTHVTPTWESLKRYALNQIDECKLKIPELDRLKTPHEITTHELPNSRFQRFTEYASEIVDSQCLKKKRKLQNSLHAPTPQLNFPHNPRLYVHNFSDVVLYELQLEALSRGPKFCGYRENTKQNEIDIQFENLMSPTVWLIPSSEENLDHFKTTLVECSHRYHRYTSKYRSILTKKHKEALRELQNNKDIIISRPDKGSGVVIMNKSDYIDKLHSILNDCSKFQKSNSTKDNIEINEQCMVECLKRLKEQGTIDETLYEKLRPHGTATPRLCGLPKMHKQGIPVRPILDMSNSPYHATAK